MGQVRALVIPWGIKSALLAWLITWLPLRAAAYPPSSWLSFCAFGSVILTIGVLLENRFLVSWQAVALTLGQLIYVADAITRGSGTSYLFDAGIPLAVRSLSLFHFVMPAVAIYAVQRLGYDRRALVAQIATAAVVLPISFAFGPANINLVWSGPAASSALPALVNLVIALIGFLLFLYLPAHAAFVIRSAGSPARTRRGSPRRHRAS